MRPVKPIVRSVLLIPLIVLTLFTFITPAPSVAQADELQLPSPELLTDPVWARPGYADLSQRFARRTRYLLSLDLDSSRGRIAGKARVLYVNTTGTTLNQVVFRLYPNHPVHSGRTMQISAVNVNGLTAQFTFLDNAETAISIPLPTALPPNTEVPIDFVYTITTSATAFYYISEPFPMAAVYDSTGWRTDLSTKGLDYAYSESALMAVNLRAATSDQTWFVGAVKSSTDDPNGRTTYTIVTGPVRNFIVIRARGGRALDLTGASVPVRVLYMNNPGAAQQIGELAVGIFNFYEQNYAAYPYAEFDVIAVNFPSGGEEYPSIVFINNARNLTYWRFITAHEVGHQWFYGLAGNDTLRHAWLDESMTQIAGYLYYKYAFDQATADVYWTSIQTWSSRVRQGRLIDTPVEDFVDFNDYMSTTYGKGAEFLRALGERIGDDRLIAGMRSYVQNTYLGIGTPDSFFAAVQAQTAVDLRPLFCEQVGRPC